MNHFSNLLATEYFLDVRLRLSAVTNNGLPRCLVRVNDLILYLGDLDQSQDLRCQVPLKSHVHVCIEVSNKIHSLDRDTAVVIDSLTLDGFDLVPNYVHLARYENEADYQDPTTYLGFNGRWQLDIDQPFYVWRHRATGQGWLLQPCPIY
jgi:hypothetical protein